MKTSRREAISSLSEELVLCDDPQKLLELITRRVAEIVGEGCVLTRMSEDRTTLEPISSFHPDAEVRSYIEEVVASEPYRVGEGIAGHVAAERKLAVVNGMQRTALSELMQSHGQRFEQRYPIHALVVVPVVAGGEVVGTLGAFRFESTEDYGHEDVIAMTALAERASLAIAAGKELRPQLGVEGYEAIYRYAPDGMLFTAPDGRVLSANPAACEILGMSEVEICSRGRAQLLVTDDPRTTAAVEERAKTGRVRAEVPMRRGNGSIFIAELSSSIFATEAGEARACVIFRDVSEQVALREELERHARELDELTQHDALTGLQNRRGFVPGAEEVLAIAAREHMPSQLLFLDVDELKAINDNVGHRMGDAVLQRLAAAIRDATREVDVSARLGGDEFVVLLFHAGRLDAEQVIKRITDGFAEVPAGEPPADVSVGVAEYQPGDKVTLDELIDRADKQMYAAKMRRRFRPDREPPS
jgi:diguanylate cyclase (GGDEF)-like protein/PAS domain S-box-containing protein